MRPAGSVEHNPNMRKVILHQFHLRTPRQQQRLYEILDAVDAFGRASGDRVEVTYDHCLFGDTLDYSYGELPIGSLKRKFAETIDSAIAERDKQEAHNSPIIEIAGVTGVCSECAAGNHVLCRAAGYADPITGLRFICTCEHPKLLAAGTVI